MRTFARRVVPLVAVGLPALVAGCQQSGDSERSSAPRPATATSSSAGTVADGAVPPGDYQKVVTLADARALGLRSTAKELELGPDGTQTVTLTFGDGYWSHAADYGGLPPQVGAYGTVTYEQDEQAYVIEEPCCGASRFTWELEGDRLAIEMDVDYLLEQNPELRRNSEEVLEGKLAVTGTFRRVG